MFGIDGRRSVGLFGKLPDLKAYIRRATIIISSKRQPETNRLRKITGSFEEKLFSFLHLSRAPTLSSIEWIQTLITHRLQGEQLNSFLRHFIERVSYF